MKSLYAFLLISSILINFSCDKEDYKPTTTNYLVHSNSHNEYVISTYDGKTGVTVKKAYTYPYQYQLLSSISDVAVYNDRVYVLGGGLTVINSTDFSTIAHYLPHFSPGNSNQLFPSRTFVNGDYMYVFGRLDNFYGGIKFKTQEEAAAANKAYQMTNVVFREMYGTVQQGDRIFISYWNQNPRQSHIIAFPKEINLRLSELIIPGRTFSLLTNNMNEVIAVSDSSVYIVNASNFATKKMTSPNVITRLQDSNELTREKSACLDPATNCLYFLQQYPDQSGPGLFKCLTKWDLNTNVQTDIYRFPSTRSNFNVTSLEFDAVLNRILLMGAEPISNANAGVIMLNTDGTEAGFFETEGRPLWLSIVKH